MRKMLHMYRNCFLNRVYASIQHNTFKFNITIRGTWTEQKTRGHGKHASHLHCVVLGFVWHCVRGYNVLEEYTASIFKTEVGHLKMFIAIQYILWLSHTPVTERKNLWFWQMPSYMTYSSMPLTATVKENSLGNLTNFC